MKKARIWLLIAVILPWIIARCAAPHAYRSRQIIHYRLGNTDIRLIHYDYDSLPVVWFNMHDDENTAVRAARRVVGHGRLWELRHPGGRNIRFRLHGKRYGFDPNRIYTPEGRKKTLKEFSHAYTPEADTAVARFARFVLGQVVNDAAVVVALHNNTRGRYSVESYLPGARYAADAAEVHQAPATDPDDFFYCADTLLFRRLAAAGWNALMQNNASVTDDGSLSVYCGRRGIRYVNIEAQRGHRRMQARMITSLQRILDSIVHR